MPIAEKLRRAHHEVLALTFPEFGALVEAERQGRAAFLLPLGAIQPHGPHASVGTDVLISRAMCRDACQALGDEGILGAILPGLPYGATPYFSELPGCFALRPETVAACLTDICAELARHDVRRCMVVNNNYTPEQLQAIYRVSEQVRSDLDLRLHYMDITHPARRRSTELPQAYLAGDFHAGNYETSLMLASDPDFVDEEMRRSLPDLPIDLVAKIRDGKISTAAIGATQAYIGFPASASAENGREAYANLCAMLVAAVKGMLAGDLPEGPGWYARSAQEG